jgi:rhodanese-related sulfurtransferase
MQRISVHEARDLMEKGAVLVDVREPAEFARAWVQGAVNVPLAQFDEAVARELVAKGQDGQPLVVMCLGGVRSARACACLPEDFPVAMMEEGLQGWRRENLPVEEANSGWLRGVLGA